MEGIFHHYRRIRVKPLPEFSEKYSRMNRFVKLTAMLLFLFPLAAFAAEGGSAESGSKKILPPAATPAPDNINTFLHTQVNNLTKAEPPRIEDRKLILTWMGDTRPRYVAAAFQHEAFRQKHLFWRNQNGVYFLVYDLTSESPATVEYRLIVDGLWQGDPTNPDRIRDDQGITLSRVSLKTRDLPLDHGPVQGYSGEVDFAYRGKPGQQVSIIANFNQWDPFAQYLEEISPGEYRLKLTLAPGVILYRFVVGTQSFLDPENGHSGHDDQGGTFSYFENKMTTRATVLEAAMPVSASHR